jgi:hypothetical protein
MKKTEVENLVILYINAAAVYVSFKINLKPMEGGTM